MRVAIAGAGAIGRSIAQALLDARHKVLLIERDIGRYRPHLVPDADWMLADACEAAALQAADLGSCDAVMAAAGDDKVNLVFALLAKTEFAVPRVVARVNNPENQWMYTDAWGVDVAVSTPNSLVAAVDVAVRVEDVVRVMTLQQGGADLLQLTVPEASPLVDAPVTDLALPVGAALLAVIRDGTLVPSSTARLRAGDELLLAAAEDVVPKLRDLIHRGGGRS